MKRTKVRGLRLNKETLAQVAGQFTHTVVCNGNDKTLAGESNCPCTHTCFCSDVCTDACPPVGTNYDSCYC